MEIRVAPNHLAVKRMTTEELRENFLVGDLFRDGEISMIYSDVDRAIIGGIVPISTPLRLLASKKEMAAEYFCERREAGIINLAGPGTVTVDGTSHSLLKHDVLYIGRGSKEVVFSSQSPDQPAHFYLMSYPAHKEFPTVLAKFADAEPQPLGTAADANRRTIYKYIHLNGIKSCQLVMGMTILEEGSVWNTMPSHTHVRRSEVYLYFNMAPNTVVFHFMGEPNQTRNIVIRNEQAVISPSWSIHSGVGTRAYSFVWGMGGENQEFSDMDAVAMKDLL